MSHIVRFHRSEHQLIITIDLLTISSVDMISVTLASADNNLP